MKDGGEEENECGPEKGWRIVAANGGVFRDRVVPARFSSMGGGTALCAQLLCLLEKELTVLSSSRGIQPDPGTGTHPRSASSLQNRLHEVEERLAQLDPHALQGTESKEDGYVINQEGRRRECGEEWIKKEPSNTGSGRGCQRIGDRVSARPPYIFLDPTPGERHMRGFRLIKKQLSNGQAGC